MKLSKYLVVVSTLLLTIIMLILSLVLYYDTKAEIKIQNQQSGIVKFNQYVEYLEGNFGMLEKLRVYLLNDTSFHKLLNIRSDNIVDAINKKYSVENYLTNIVKNNDVISSINIISNQSYYNYGPHLFKQELINEFKNKSIQKTYSFNISAEDPYACDMKTTGILINKLDEYSYIEFSFLSEESISWNVFIILNQKFLFRDSDDLTNIAFLDRNDVLYKGSILNHLKNEHLYILKNETGLSYKQGVHNLNLYSKKFPVNDFTAIYAVDATMYIQKLNSIRLWMLFICITSLILSFGASQFISKKITKPLQALTKQINAYQLDTSITSAKTYKKKVTLKSKLFLNFVLTTIIPMSIYLILFFVQSKNIISEMVTDSSKSIFTKISIQINRTVANKIRIIQMLSFNETVQNFFTSPSKYVLNDVNNILENMRYVGLDRDSVSIYSDKDTLLFSDRQTKMQDNMIDSFGVTKRGIVCSYNTDSIGDKFLSFSIPVVSMLKGEHWGEKLGYCRIDSEIYRFKDMIEPIEAFGGSAAIIDRNAKMLLYTKKCDWSINQPLQIHDKYMWIEINGNLISCYNLISGTNLYTMAQFNLKNIMQLSRPFVQTYIYLFLVLSLGILIISYLISVNILGLIAKLNNKIKTYDLSGGNLPGECENKKFYIDEIDSLNESFVRMSERIETLVDDLIIANNERNMIDVERKSAEMTALQAQINPHFLYNTFNNFIALIRLGSYDEAISAIKLLGALFRYGISRKEVIIPIREELEYAKVYAQLIKIRFGDRVSFVWDIDESVYSFTTIKLILQPLIENSIHHGFGVECMKGTISIKCMEDVNEIKFEISDNGRGISQEVLNDINETLESSNHGNHIGILNVQRRLMLHYGKSYNLEIISAIGEGTTVSIRIPKNIKKIL